MGHSPLGKGEGKENLPDGQSTVCKGPRAEESLTGARDTDTQSLWSGEQASSRHRGAVGRSDVFFQKGSF